MSLLSAKMLTSRIVQPGDPALSIQELPDRSEIVFYSEVGGIPILHMRAFGKEKKLPQALVEDVMTRARRAAPRV